MSRRKKLDVQIRSGGSDLRKSIRSTLRLNRLLDRLRERIRAKHEVTPNDTRAA